MSVHPELFLKYENWGFFCPQMIQLTMLQWVMTRKLHLMDPRGSCFTSSYCAGLESWKKRCKITQQFVDNVFFRKCSSIELKHFEHMPRVKLKGERIRTGHFSNFLSLVMVNFQILHLVLAPPGDCFLFLNELLQSSFLISRFTHYFYYLSGN